MRSITITENLGTAWIAVDGDDKIALAMGPKLLTPVETLREGLALALRELDEELEHPYGGGLLRHLR